MSSEKFSSLEKYGASFITKVISLLLTNKTFLQNISDVLSDEYFSNKSQKWLINEILAYNRKYHTYPSLDVLKIEVKKIDDEVLQIAVKEQLKEAYVNAEESDLAYVEEEFSGFCKNQQLKKALLSSVDLLNAGDYDSIRHLIDNALKAGQDKNIGHEYNKDIESRYREDHRIIVPTPWKDVNDLLQGGLGNGDFGLFFGSPGGGKSWALVALGSEALKRGKNVIHYTLELSEDYVGRRYDAYLTGIPVDKILKSKKEVEEVVGKLEGEVIIKEFPMGRTSVYNIESHIKKCINLGFKPDLIIIDYVDCLSSRQKNRDRKDEIDDIYVNVKGLAKAIQLPIWSVSQVNRAGAKDNVIEGDKSAGSYDKLMISDAAISLSRKKEDKVNGTGRFHFMKNRYGADGMTFSVKIDTSTGHFDILGEFTEEDDNAMTKREGRNSYNGVDNFDKQFLKQKFKELNTVI